jgi:hypothetical protein
MLVTLDAYDGSDRYDGLSVSQSRETGNAFCQSIFSNADTTTLRFAKTAVLNRAMVEEKAADIFSDRFGQLKPMDPGGSVGGKIDIHFGPDGTSVSGGVYADAHDDNGNHAGVEVQINNDQTVDVSFSGSRDVGDQEDK